ncbi:diadenylate cyclase CdaA [Balneola vulgaris]|uniref:diadenylate cyclase CdaA n=1 Tax=Balneola vulgaris TaxID=287535 RepID=UPI000369CFAD|nr:diadenylate cyclase CdaA [Balneola vulgaris]
MIPIGFLEFGLKDFIETLIIAGVLVYLYRWIRGTFAIQATIGIFFVILINFIIRLLGFETINFILKSILDVGILAVFILFQPEIRKLLYRIGNNTSFDRFFSRTGSSDMIDEIIEATKKMAKHRTGALIVFARSSSLQDLVDAGVKIDSAVKSELITTIFQKDTPLHDGAVVIRNNRIVAASCYLPISQNPNIAQSFGTRHRAAVGISETNNVLVLVVSEETGRVSLARNGTLTSGLTIQKLRAEMEEAFGKSDFEADLSFGAAQSEMNLK